MACGSSFYEENPAKDQRREEMAADKNLKAAKKIADFIQKRLRGSCVAVTKTTDASREVKKVALAVKGRNLTVHHRGYTISTNCDDPASLSAEFRNWLAIDMTHITKIEPRTH